MTNTTNTLRGTNVDHTGASGAADALSDEWLMKSYIEGNEPCFGILVHRYERELYSYLRRLLVDPVLAEDVFQNTFLQVHLKRALYDIGRPFRPWLYKIGTHQAIDAMRRNRRYPQTSLNYEHDNGRDDSAATLMDTLVAKASDPVVVAEASERRLLVRAAVDGLAEHLRSVVVLSYYQGMKYKEIAEILQIPVGTVKSRLHAAIGRLGEKWEAMGLTRSE